jgi:hypothetical protein
LVVVLSCHSAVGIERKQKLWIDGVSAEIWTEVLWNTSLECCCCTCLLSVSFAIVTWMLLLRCIWRSAVIKLCQQKTNIWADFIVNLFFLPYESVSVY